jgi:hypothetical protein
MAEEDAKKIIKATLDQFNLGSLADQVWRLQADETLPPGADIDTIGFVLKDTPEFQKRFPALKKRPELSVSAYIGLERGYENAMRGSGLPTGFYDTSEDFTAFIEGNTSVAEVQTRVNEGYKAVAQANPEVIAQMKELYGVTDGDLAAYFLDPAKATDILVRQATAAQISSEGKRQAGIQLTAQEAEALAKENVTQAEAQKAFAEVGSQQELYNPLQGEQAITQREAIAAATGTDQAARQRVETRKRQRQASFAGGGSFATSQTGLTGLGSVG